MEANRSRICRRSASLVSSSRSCNNLYRHTIPCRAAVQYSSISGADFRLDARTGNIYCPNMDKKVARVLRKIPHVRGLSADEKYLFARSLAETPDDRWTPQRI